MWKLLSINKVFDWITLASCGLNVCVSTRMYVSVCCSAVVAHSLWLNSYATIWTDGIKSQKSKYVVFSYVKCREIRFRTILSYIFD